jgi:hypothetical protein
MRLIGDFGGIMRLAGSPYSEFLGKLKDLSFGSLDSPLISSIPISSATSSEVQSYSTAIPAMGEKFGLSRIEGRRGEMEEREREEAGEGFFQIIVLEVEKEDDVETIISQKVRNLRYRRVSIRIGMTRIGWKICLLGPQRGNQESVCPLAVSKRLKKVSLTLKVRE